MTSSAKIDALRELLLDDDRKQRDELSEKLHAIQTLLSTREELEGKVDPIIEDRLEAFSEAIPQKLGPAITAALKTEIVNSRDQVVDALYPIIGKMIKKYISHEMAVLKEQIELTLKKAFSWKAMWLRLRCKMTGRSPADLILYDLNGPELEEMLVIENNSGLLKGSYSRNETIDRDMVAGMLTAIKSFVEDAFQKGTQDLEHIQYEGFHIHLYSFSSFYIAVIVSGVGSASFDMKLRDTVMNFSERYLKEGSEKLEEDKYIENQLESYFA